MRFATTVFAIGCCLSLVGISAGQQRPVKSAQVSGPVMTVRTYSVSDLPVWSKEGSKFDPSILVLLLKSKIAPDQWTEKSSISTYAEKNVLVVNAMPGVHEVIAAELASIRKQ